MKPLELSEAEIQKQIIDFLEAIHVRIYRNNTGRRGGVQYGLCKGSFDLIGNFHGIFLAIEVKKPKEKLSEDQLKFQKDILSDGGIAFRAESITDVRKQLAKINKKIVDN